MSSSIPLIAVTREYLGGCNPVDKDSLLFLMMKDGSPIIQISAPTSPGNSGGPVINELGEVIGMVTFGSVNYENYTFIVPSNTIKSFIHQAGLLTNSSSGTQQEVI